MRTFGRRVVATSLAALLAGGALGAAPVAAGAGPVVIDDHDSFVPTRAYEVSSSTGATVFGTDIGGYGQLYLMAAPMTTGTTAVNLGERPRTYVPTSIVGSRVVMPVAGATYGSAITSVKSCLVGTCPTMSTLAMPAGWTYIGNANDRAVVFNTATNELGLVLWTGALDIAYAMPVPYAHAPTAVGDSNGVVVYGGGEVTYLHRPTGTVSHLGYGNEATLTPTYVAWYGMGVGESEPYRTVVYRATRTATGTVVSTPLPGDPSLDVFAATDTGMAFLVPSGAEDGESLYTMAHDGTPVLYPRPVSHGALAAFQNGGSFVVNDRQAGIPGFYRVAPGGTSGALVGLVPIRPANTYALSVSNGRAVYTDDMTYDMPMFARDVLNGTAGTETTVTGWTGGWAAGLSGPYVAFTREGSTDTTAQVLYGRVGGPYTAKTFPASEVGTVGISGRTVYVTHGAKARLVDVLTNTVTDLGRTFVSVSGPYAYTVSYDTGKVARRDLRTGVTTTIRNAISGCTTYCVDEELTQISAWGDGVVYAFESDAGLVAEHWSPATGRRALPMLTTGGARRWFELKYWGGLLLVSRSDFTVRLYDLRTSIDTTGVAVDTDAERPLGLDGHVAAWRPNSHLRAVVRDLRDFYPGYVAEPRLVSTDAAPGFGPGLGSGTWSPSMVVSQDVAWTLEVRKGGVAGTVVHTASGTSAYGEISVPAWDGTDLNTAAPADQGTYTWVLKGTATAATAGPVPLKNAEGTSDTVTGTVYFSKTALAAPAVTAPARASDTSASSTFTVAWTPPAGAPAGTKYSVYRSTNGGLYGLYKTTTGTSVAVAGAAGSTYRFKVRAVDPAGRSGTLSAVKTTMVPHDAGGSVTGTWTTAVGSSFYRGSQRRASAAGAMWSFTATGTQIHLIGTKAANYGKFSVSIDGGAYSPLVDSYSPTTKYRQVLFTKTGLSSGTHTIKVKVAGTSGRPYVGVDGVAYLR